MKKFISLFIIIPLIFSQCFRKNSSQDYLEYDNIMHEQFKADGPGAVALVSKNNKVLYSKAFGMANMELEVPMDTGNVFRIGSITKQFTACAILKLAEEGKLSISDNITKYIPDYPSRGVHISVENLLTHSSGIKSFTGMKEWTCLLYTSPSPRDGLLTR